MIGPDSGPRRFFCGRSHRPPLLIRFLDAMRYHQELYYIRGQMRIRRRWVWTDSPGRSIYTCRKPNTHWRATIKPPGQQWVNLVHDTRGAEVPKEIKGRKTPYWKARALKVTRENESIQIATPSWEIGHKYEFTRWETLV